MLNFLLHFTLLHSFSSALYSSAIFFCTVFLLCIFLWIQERTATATALSSNAIRWVMGPSGTVVAFPNEMGLPSIFEPKACSYPPPREKCAGPSCMNTYKYRDSKSKLPLCGLQCYKSIREKIQPLSAC